MNILLFGATGMVGQGALRKCLLAPDVTRVHAVGRRASGPPHPRLTHVLLQAVFDILSVPLLPLLRRLLPDTLLSSGIPGRAMLALARRGAPAALLEAADISALGRGV